MAMEQLLPQLGELNIAAVVVVVVVAAAGVGQQQLQLRSHAGESETAADVAAG